MLKIDVFPHILPKGFYDRLMDAAPAQLHMLKRMRNLPALWDLDHRFAIMDRHEGYVQILTLAAPPIESVGPPDLTAELAKLANDQMAELVEKHPDRFPGFVASMAMNNPDACLREIDRACGELGAAGIQVFSNANGIPLDRPEYRPLFDRMAELDLPIWLHPARVAGFADYPDEPRSKYDIWWAFGWPYETSAAMARLVFSGVFDQHPNLRIITHHLGAMIPYFEGRIGGGLDQLGKRTDDPKDMAARGRLKKRPIDYFHMFYGDTALFGSAPAMECGLAFFGPDRVLFGTDYPFDPEGGPGFVRDTIAAMDKMRASEQVKQQIYEGNARRMLRLPKLAKY